VTRSDHDHDKKLAPLSLGLRVVRPADWWVDCWPAFSRQDSERQADTMDNDKQTFDDLVAAAAEETLRDERAAEAQRQARQEERQRALMAELQERT
jgi:hypothetical protein